MPSLPPNVEKAVFMPGAYRIYDAAGRVWIARKVHNNTWRATPGANNSARAITTRVDAQTLTQLAEHIAPLVHIVARQEDPF